MSYGGRKYPDLPRYQTNYLLDHLIRKLEKSVVEEGACANA